MLSINLQDKVAIVTGVSSGIGAGVAKVLAQAGCHVAGCAQTKEDDVQLEGFINSVSAYDRQAYYRSVDVTNKDEIVTFVEEAGHHFGKIDIVISNAGANIFKGVEECTEEEWGNNLKLNLGSHWRIAKEAKPWLEKEGSGVFIVMTSNHAYSTMERCFPYNVSKTALTGLVRALALEWGPEIRVLGLAPGFINTPGNDTYFQSFADPAAEFERTTGLHPTGNLGSAEEIGAWCAFLASEYASFATGTTYLVDGGRSALLQDRS